MCPMPQATVSNSTNRRRNLFDLLKLLREMGGRFEPLSRLDGLVDEAQAALLIKHDVHGVPLAALLEFAEAELEMGVVGTYFFMAPNHPLTSRVYSFSEQVEAMRQVRSMGHDIGLHIDPYFMMDHLEQALREILILILRQFEDENVPVCCGNMHGNSRFKMLDRNGYETSFDFFEQLGRQQDYPVLADVPEEKARLIRDNRISLKDFGFTHWADMPLWSARHGFVVTNFITDNQLGKRGTIEIVTHEHTCGQYKLADIQPPGSTTPSEPRRLVACTGFEEATECLRTGAFPTGSFTLGFESDEVTTWFRRLSSHPTLFLVHPQHYV